MSEDRKDEQDKGKDAVEKPKPVDRLVTTHHTLSTTEGELAYTAVTGRIVIGEEEMSDDVFKGWQPRAEMAVTAYTLDGADVTQRPVTFVFNGGPGSASLWLHMGLLGPRIVDMGDVGALTPPPYGLRDNKHTLLRASDLVFIDPMSTGLTRSVEGGKPADYHGFTRDVEQVSELIRLWCTRHDRWMSPKYVLGESYGTTRGVSIAEHLLSRYGMALNGIVLISSVLNFGAQGFEQDRWDEACIGFLPTYAAIAAYHGVTQCNDVEALLLEAEEFAQTDYRVALARGNDLPESDRDRVVAKLVELTGLSEQFIRYNDLRIEHWRFCGELLRERGLDIGRIDGRFTGPKERQGAEFMDTDPSMSAMIPPYAAAIQHYLRAELGCELEHSYEVFASGIKKWSYAEFEGKPIDVSARFERIMRRNVAMRARIEYGWYDLATPWGAARDMVRHLDLPSEARERIEHAEFPTGHMPYLHEESRIREADGIAAFVRSASNR